MKLFLIGLPGSGKSTIGKILAKKMSLKFIDTDEEIIARENASIEELFDTKGEEWFRLKEKEVINELSKSFEGIISTGGGLPCFYDNMDLINSRGVSVFLRVSPEGLTERLWAMDKENRPMLKGKSKDEVLKFIKNKYEDRLPFYTKARIIMEGDFISAEDILERLKSEKIV